MIGQVIKRLLRIDHDVVIVRNAAERIRISRIGRDRHRKGVVRHAGDFIPRSQRPGNARVRSVNVDSRAALGAHAFSRVCRYANCKCLIVPDGI